MGKDRSLEYTKRLMAALVQMPPKPHYKMKAGKPQRAKATDRPPKRRASAAAKSS
jgi:hypothetical protein